MDTVFCSLCISPVGDGPPGTDDHQKQAEICVSWEYAEQ